MGETARFPSQIKFFQLLQSRRCRPGASVRDLLVRRGRRSLGAFHHNRVRATAASLCLRSSRRTSRAFLSPSLPRLELAARYVSGGRPRPASPRSKNARPSSRRRQPNSFVLCSLRVRGAASSATSKTSTSSGSWSSGACLRTRCSSSRARATAAISSLRSPVSSLSSTRSLLPSIGGPTTCGLCPGRSPPCSSRASTVEPHLQAAARAVWRNSGRRLSQGAHLHAR